jgi:hypothetical protein
MVKDTAQAVRCDKLDVNKHFLKFIDVDYYVDMHFWMSYGIPMLLYTFIPETAGGVVGSSMFCMSDNNVHCSVLGGPKYSHLLWDYNLECVIEHYLWGSITFKIERKRVSLHRQIILLTPERIFYGPLSWFLPGDPLKRFLFSHHLLTEKEDIQYNMFRVHESDGVNVTMSLADSYAVGVMPVAEFDGLRIRMACSTNTVIAQVERFLTSGKADEDMRRIAAPLIFRIIKGAEKLTNVSVSTHNFNYQTLSPLIYDEGKDKGRLLFDPYYDATVIPKSSYNNDVETVRGRLTNVKPDPTLDPTKFYYAARDEFLNFVSQDFENQLEPVELTEVLENQTRASQKRLNSTVTEFMFGGFFKITAFLKGESYPKITSPRNISTHETGHKLGFSQFTLAAARVLKQQAWYGFGLSPSEITAKMHDIGLKSRTLTASDFSRYDGTLSQYLRDLEKLFYLRIFNSRFSREIIELHDVQLYAKGTTSEGYKYNVGTSRTSGSPETSLGNSLINAYNAYMCYRQLGLSPADAWQSMQTKVIIGGDDGVLGDVTAERFIKTSEGLQLIAKAEVITTGPISFLARLHFAFEREGSCCDIPRQFGKLHFSFSSRGVPLDTVLFRKATSLIITDCDTLFLGPWALAVLTILDNQGYKTVKLLEDDVDSSWSARPFILPEASDWWKQFLTKPVYTSLPADLQREILLETTEGFLEVEDKFNEHLNRAVEANDMSLLLDLPNLITPPELPVEVSAEFRGEVLTKTKEPAMSKFALSELGSAKAPKLRGKNRSLSSTAKPRLNNNNRGSRFPKKTGRAQRPQNKKVVRGG